MITSSFGQSQSSYCWLSCLGRKRQALASITLISFLWSCFLPTIALAEVSREKQSGIVNRAEDFKINKPIDFKDKKDRGDTSSSRSSLVAVDLASKAKSSKDDKLLFSGYHYYPYLEIGANSYFHQKTSKVAGVYDFFVPLLQDKEQLFFADFRIFDRDGSSFEGNLHLGVRSANFEKNNLWGGYLAFDQRRSNNRHRFRQLTMGLENWHGSWFIGGNCYQPIGKRQYNSWRLRSINEKPLEIVEYTERALAGMDAQVGYSFNDRFSGYLGGYYFHSKDQQDLIGPKINLSYRYDKESGKLFKIIDELSLELGAQYDQVRGGSAYLGAKLRFGLSDKLNPAGFARHFTELVRRDPDIVLTNLIVNKITVQTTKKVNKLLVAEAEKPGGGSEAGASGASDTKKDQRYFDKLKKRNKYEAWSIEELTAYQNWLSKQLNLPPNLTVEEARKQYREFTLKYHPDKQAASANRQQRQIHEDFFRAQWEQYHDLYAVSKVLSRVSDSLISPATFAISLGDSVGSAITNHHQEPLQLSPKTWENGSQLLVAMKNPGAEINQQVDPISDSDNHGFGVSIINGLDSTANLVINSAFPFLSLITKARAQTLELTSQDQSLSSTENYTQPTINLKQFAIAESWLTNPIVEIENVYLEVREDSAKFWLEELNRDLAMELAKNPAALTDQLVAEIVMLLDFISHHQLISLDLTQLSQFLRLGIKNGWKAPRELIDQVFLIFSAFNKLPKNFNYLVLDLFAQEQELPSLPFSGYLQSFLKLELSRETIDEQAQLTSLLIMKKLIQFELTLPIYQLDQIRLMLSSSEKHLKLAALDLILKFRWVDASWLTELTNELALLSSEVSYLRKLEIEEFLFRHQIKLPAVKAQLAIEPSSSNMFSNYLVGFLEWLSKTLVPAKIITPRGHYVLPAWFSQEMAADFRRLEFGNADEVKKLSIVINNYQISQEHFTNMINQASASQQLEAGKLPVADFYLALLYSLVEDIFLLNQEIPLGTRRMLSRVVGELLDYSWLAVDLFEVLAQGDLSYLSLIERLANYQVGPDFLNRYGISAQEIIQTHSPAEASWIIDQLISDRTFSLAKNQKTILQEFVESNHGYPEIEKLAQIFNQQLDLIWQRQPALEGWQAEDFLNWRKQLVFEISSVDKVLSVITQVARRTILDGTAYPRTTQLLSLLSLISAPGGSLAEIATGEGKSLIIAMLAAYHGLMGRSVDVVTSSGTLAIRDAQNPLYQNFFNLLGLSVSHNVSDATSYDKACYQAEVVYGDVRHFIGDVLREINQEVKFGRGFDLVIVDEVDNLLIDQSNIRLLLTGNAIPGFDSLGQIFVYLWGVTTKIAATLFQEVDRCYLKVPAVSQENSQEPSVTELIPLSGVTDCLDFIKDYVKRYAYDELLTFDQPRAERTIVLPAHLEDFVKYHLNDWLEALVHSYNLVDGVNYVVRSSPEVINRNDQIIIPVDYDNTGELNPLLRWSDGMHQYLQLRHGVPLTEEGLVSFFLSYSGFFKKYHGNLYGVTGTLGTKAHHDFLYRNYEVTSQVIPTFAPKQFTEFPRVVVASYAEWVDEVLGVINRQIVNRRAVLIILPSIKEVEQLAEILISKIAPDKLHTYGLGDPKEMALFKRELIPGEIIIATNLAGRGSDFRLSHEVLKHGGLHVILNRVAFNIRVERQAFGRAARKGDPGSAQLIIEFDDLSAVEFSELQNLRELKEITSLINQEQTLRQFHNLDLLFNRYVALVRELDSPTGYNLTFGFTEKQQPFHLYLYLDHHQIILKLVDEARSDTLDLTSKIALLLPKSLNHLRKIIERQQVTELTKGETELIHFIASHHGYTKYPELNKQLTLDLKLLSENPSFLVKRWELASKLPFIKLLESGDELSRRYLLWLVEREYYGKHYEIKQLEEDWGIWLKEHEGLARDSFEAVFQAFEDFRAQVLLKAKQGQFFSNPAYLLQQARDYLRQDIIGLNRLSDAKHSVERAISLDPERSWPAYHLRSELILTEASKASLSKYKRSHVEAAGKIKSRYFESLKATVEGIENRMIPELEAELAFLISNGELNSEDELFVQLIGTIEVNREIAKRLKESLLTVINTSPREMIRVKEFHAVAEVIDSIDLSARISEITGKPQQQTNFAGRELIQSQLEVLGVGGIYEIETYQLKKSNRWLNNVFVGVLGVASIFTGTFLVNAFTGNVFAQALGGALIYHGVGDLAVSLVSVALGEPLDLGDYLHSKGISLGVSLATAGILGFLDQIEAIHDLGLLRRVAEAGDNLGEIAAIQAATMAVNVALYDLTRKNIDVEDLEQEALKAAAEIINDTKEDLFKLFNVDVFLGDQELQQALYQGVADILRRYEKKHHRDEQEFVKRVASGIFGQLGSIVKTGVDLVLDLEKDRKAISRAKVEIINLIKTLAASTDELDLVKLIMLFPHENGTAARLLAALKEQNYVVDNNLILHCDRFTDLRVAEDLLAAKRDFIASCNEVNLNSIRLSDQRSTIESAVSAFQESLVRGFRSLAIEIKKDVIKDAINLPGGYLGDKLGRAAYAGGEKLYQQIRDRSKLGSAATTREKLDFEAVLEDSGLRKEPSVSKISPELINNLSRAAELAVIEVQAGDNLSKLAARYDVSLAEMIAVNPQLKNPNLIYPGQRLKLPLTANLIFGGSHQLNHHYQSSNLSPDSNTDASNPKLINLAAEPLTLSPALAQELTNQLSNYQTGFNTKSNSNTLSAVADQLQLVLNELYGGVLYYNYESFKINDDAAPSKLKTRNYSSYKKFETIAELKKEMGPNAIAIGIRELDLKPRFMGKVLFRLKDISSLDEDDHGLYHLQLFVTDNEGTLHSAGFFSDQYNWYSGIGRVSNEALRDKNENSTEHERLAKTYNGQSVIGRMSKKFDYFKKEATRSDSKPDWSKLVSVYFIGDIIRNVGNIASNPENNPAEKIIKEVLDDNERYHLLYRNCQTVGKESYIRALKKHGQLPMLVPERIELPKLADYNIEGLVPFGG